MRSSLSPSRALILAAGLVGVGAPLVATEPATDARFQRISIAEGLSQPDVAAILQDRYGFLWFGTVDGLDRFDGFDFERHESDPADPHSLSSNPVRVLLESRDGVVWVGTDNGGLNRYDATTRTFTSFRHDPAVATSLGSDRVRALVEEPGGRLWVGTDGGGLSRFDPDMESFVTFVPHASEPDSLGHLQVRALVLDRQNRLWIGTDGGGLDVLTVDTLTFRHFRNRASDTSSLCGDRVISLLEDRDGTILVGTNGSGLCRLDPETGRFEPLRGNEVGSSDTIRAILRDTSGALLVGTDDGLAEWDGERGRFVVYRHDASDPFSLSHDRVSSLYEDRSGVIWAGTQNGLNLWNKPLGVFPHYTASASTGGLGHPYVTAFAEGPGGSLWIGTHGGVFRWSSEAGFRPLGGRLADDRVMSLEVDLAGELWIGTLTGGLHRFNPSSGALRRYAANPADPDSLASSGVTTILEDRLGNLWIGTYRGGLSRYLPETDTFTSYRHDPADERSLSSDLVVSLFEDGDGFFWIGTDGGGLNRLNRDTGTFERFRYAPAEGDGLSSDHVWTFAEAPNGELWIGTQGGGLNRWSLENRRESRPVFDRYLRQHGLPSTVIYSSLFDSTGRLWLSTANGLALLDPETGRIRRFDTSHGLQGEEFNFGAALRAEDGRLYFGGINGFNAFDPEEIRPNETVPLVVLTSFRKFNREILFETPTPDVRDIVLDHDDSVITFEFAALDFVSPRDNVYRYELEGFDRNWNDAIDQHQVTYTNLDPGSYIFRVQAANGDGTWNREGLEVALRVKPPPWATGWAYLGYALLVIGMIGGLAFDQNRRFARAAELEETNRALQSEVAQRQVAEAELQKLSMAVEQSPSSVIITDPDGKIEYVNPQFERVTGYRLDDVRGQSFELLRSGYGSTSDNVDIQSAIAAGQIWRSEVHSRKENGVLFWEDVSVSAIHGADDEISHLLVTSEDLTIRKEFETKLVRQAHYDHLTQLPNRALALDRLGRALARSDHEGKQLAVLYLDLDNFKIVNDTLGHSAGDELLREASRRLDALIRQNDTLARLGGDEFLVILPEIESVVDAEHLVRRIQESFSAPVVVDQRELFVTVSVGITIAPEDGNDAHELLRNADAAMYKAKEAGRNAYRFFRPHMNRQSEMRLRLESNLRQAIERRELRLEFQPVVEAKTHQIIGAEALLRWDSQMLGEVAPTEFIPIAEDTGLIIAIGDWVLETACREARNWLTLLQRDIRVAVNISARQLRHDLVGSVRRVLETTHLPAHCLELELTEGVLLDERWNVQGTLEELSRLGVRLAIDDFGTGYSSLSYLQRFPFDSLKIDRSFVHDLGGSEASDTLVRAILAMAKGLGLEVIAEGVESRRQLERLQALDAGLIQGFYFSKPTSASKIAQLLAEGRLDPEGQLDREAQTTGSSVTVGEASD